jgi:hypothetical protein
MTAPTPADLVARLRAMRISPEPDPDHAVWYCKIGDIPRHLLPPGSDCPMRDAVEAAFQRLTDRESDYIFSGWAATLTEGELAVVENREPVYEKTDWATLTEAADLIERLTSSREQVTEFAREILLNRFGTLDGGDLQDLGVKHGLLVPIEATEPCGEACVCVEYDDFPQTCYRFGPALHGDANA